MVGYARLYVAWWKERLYPIDYIQIFLSRVEELYLRLTDFSSTILLEILANPQPVLRRLKLDMAAIAKYFNGGDDTGRYPNIPYSGLTSIEVVSDVMITRSYSQ